MKGDDERKGKSYKEDYDIKEKKTGNKKEREIKNKK